tara:strand:- start:325 stop:477 length:153 start_codon:yes stop_codon:yes gene_type:complete
LERLVKLILMNLTLVGPMVEKETMNIPVRVLVVVDHLISTILLELDHIQM